MTPRRPRTVTPSPERSWAEVGRLVRQRRDRLGLTQNEVVTRAADINGERSISTATINIIERGARDDYRRQTLIALARALDWPDDAVDRLRAGDDLDAIVGEPPVTSAKIRNLERRVKVLEERLEAAIAAQSDGNGVLRDRRVGDRRRAVTG